MAERAFTYTWLTYDDFISMDSGSYFSLTWDGRTFVASRAVHELQITIRDGRSFTAHIDDLALARQDTWNYLRDIDEGFRSLSRRKGQRGL